MIYILTCLPVGHCHWLHWIQNFKHLVLCVSVSSSAAFRKAGGRTSSGSSFIDFFLFFLNYFFLNTAFKPKALEGIIFFVSNPVPQCIYEQVALIKTVSRFWEYGGVDCTKCLKKNCKHCTCLVLC